MLKRKYLQTLAIGLCIAGFASCGRDDTPVVDGDDAAAVVFQRVYHFLDEIQEGHPHFEPKAIIGYDLRTILALPTEAHSDWSGPSYYRWKPLPEVHRSKRIRIPESTVLEYAFGFPQFAGNTESLEVYAFGFPGSGGRLEPVETTVSLEVDDGESISELFSYALDPSDELIVKGWMASSADLSKFAGKAVEFIFTTRRTGGNGEDSDAPNGTTVVWADPVLVRKTVEGTERSPNVVLISLDTLRADHLGCYGYGPPTSPHIDAFAEEALLFEKAFASSSWTLPSHASLFTGVPPSTHGGTHWGHLSQARGANGRRSLEAVPTIDESFEMLGEIARAQGLRTAAFTEGGYVRPFFGFAQGFERYVAPSRESDPKNPLNVDALRTFRTAADWLYTVKDQAFFIFLHTYQVHEPYAPPEGYLDRLGTPRESSIGEEFHFWRNRDLDALTEEDVKKIIDLYDAEIIYVDEVVNAFLNTLKQLDLWENTLVILLSDHGDEFFEHGGFGHSSTLYDEVTHIPLIIKLPGSDPLKGRVPDLVELADVYATLCDAMGWPQGETSTAQSFLSLFPGYDDSYDKEYVFSEIGFREGGRTWLVERPMSIALRSNTDKYFWYREGASESLYLVAEDPGETEDRRGDFPERVDSHRERAMKYLREARGARSQMTLVGSGKTAITQEHQEELEALGYIQ